MIRQLFCTCRYDERGWIRPLCPEHEPQEAALHARAQADHLANPKAQEHNVMSQPQRN
jgi:hypothetical protein